MSVDLFEAMNYLFTKRTYPFDDYPSAFIMHRFLASDMDYALACGEAAKIRDDQMVFAWWRAILPQGRGAPFFTYTAPKKRAAAEELVERLMGLYCYTREQAEEAIDLLRELGHAEDMHAYFGVEETDAG